MEGHPLTGFGVLGLTGETIGWTAGGVAVGLAIGIAVVQFLFGRRLSKAREEGHRIIELARAEASNAAERTRVDAQRLALEEKQKAEAAASAKREELRELERRLAKREDLHERKTEALGLKEEALKRQDEALRGREAQLQTREGELDALIDRQKNELLRVSGLSHEDAKQTVLKMVEDDVRHEADHLIRTTLEHAQQEAKEKAREVTLMAVQRYASEHVSESTVRAVPIPSEEMKGRIIGREGRNIRAIEKATGVDIIVDDTPGVIVVSCFDKVRQTVAAESLLKLIEDGRIHPARIEEVVEGVRKEIDERVRKYGRDAVAEVNVRGVNPKVMEAMGKLAFRTSYGQNVLRHSVEVAYLSQIIADQLGLNGAIARRCGFLHDIGKAMDHEMEGGHPKIGMDFAKLHGEKEPVLNAIGGHHGDIPATSFYTPIVMAADAVSGARPGARRESLERYIQRLDQLQGIAMENEGVDEAYAIQAGREVRVMVDARKVNDDQAFVIARNIAQRVSAEMTFPGEIRVTVLRETRAVEIAR